MVKIELTPPEIQLLVSSIGQSQFYGRDSHLVSSALGKLEQGLESIKPIQK